MAAVIPWIFLSIAIILMVVANVMPWPMIEEYHGFFTRSIITFLVAGWLSDIWRKKERIRRKIALIVLLGYYIWITATDNVVDLSPKSIAIETAGFLCIMVWAITHAHKGKQVGHGK